MKLHIIYRLCDKPESVNGLPRPLALTKKQVIGTCFPSLVQSVEALGEAWSMTVVADDVTDETKEFIEEISRSKTTLVDITAQTQIEKAIPAFPDAQQTAKGPFTRTAFFKTPLKNAGSLIKCYEVADTINDDPEETWLYFCEDDYLHDKSMFLPRFLDFVALAKSRNFALPVFYHPTDYPDQYTRLLSRCYLFQAVTGYFREVSSTTCTFMCQLKTYRKFSSWLKECAVDDGKLSTIFKSKALIFSPIPGTATHMHEGVMSNYVNWEQVIYG